MFTLGLGFSPGMFVRFNQAALETDVEGPLQHPSVVGQVADGSLSDLYAHISWWQKAKSGSLMQQDAELPWHAVSRYTLLPNTPCTHKSSRTSGLVLCHDHTAEPQGHRRYFVQFDDTVRSVLESDLHVVVDDVAPDPVELMLAYTFSSSERKQRRDRLIQQLAEVQHATLGLAELVTARLTLLAHQAEVVVRVLADSVCRFMLADEVGLGKTIEACLILSAFRNQESKLRSLILVPATLLRQWQNELNYKFSLNFTHVTPRDPTAVWAGKAGILLTYEDLDASELLWQAVHNQIWGLLIADEAHNLRRRPALYERVRRLSRSAARTLILTATPVQRRANEYLELLRLMHPAHYASVDLPRFARMLKTQATIRDTVNYLARGMEPDDFDAIEFATEMQSVIDALDDPVLPELVARVQAVPADQSLSVASTALRYLSDNYRIESRVIRNRRTNLAIDLLPVRQLDTYFMYNPLPLERGMLESLHDYADACLHANAAKEDAVEYCRILFHAAASSSAALLPLLMIRTERHSAERAQNGVDLLLKHFAHVAQRVPAFVDEQSRMSNLKWHAERWHNAATQMLETAPTQIKAYDMPYRLAQVIRATLRLVKYKRAKVLIFSAFLHTIEVLSQLLEKLLGTPAVAEFSARLPPEMLQTEVDWFQKSDDCHILLVDETGGEGRNFQVADVIIHVDLPWTPAQIEQRIGRVDRLGRSGKVISIIPLARGTVEEDLFNLWHKGYGIFEHSISGLEIALEDVQDHVMQAFAQSTRRGLVDTLPWLVSQASDLRNAVEDERYFDEGAINWRKRRQFERIIDKYQDGEWLREDVLEWAKLGHKESYYDAKTKVTLLGPTGADLAAIAKLAEARQRHANRRRSSLESNKVLIGTFHREVAVNREELTFFTLGQKHVDRIVNTVQNAARWRCCAVQHSTLNLSEDWCGFEFFYRLSVDPHPLFAAGLPACHLRRIQGYLPDATMRVLVDTNGVAVLENSPIRRWIEQRTETDQLFNLGGGKHQPQQAEKFKRSYPPAEWQGIVAQAVAAAEREVERNLAAQCAGRMATAKQELEQSTAGQWAAFRWLYGETDSIRVAEIRQLEAANAALLRGLEHPRWQLESICFWVLKAGVARGS